MKNKRDQLNNAFHDLRDDTLAETVAAMETPAIPQVNHARRWLTATAACLAAALTLGALLTLPLMRNDGPSPTPPPTTGQPSSDQERFFYDAPIVKLISLSAEKTVEGITEGESDMVMQIDEDIRINHQYYLLFEALEEGETLTLTSRNTTLAQASVRERPGYDRRVHIKATTDYLPSITFDPTLTQHTEPIFLWNYLGLPEEARTEGNIYEDCVDFVIRNADGHITGAGSLYLANKKVMTIEENNSYFKHMSISRGKVLGSVRFDNPASVTDEQIETLLSEMHGKAEGLSENFFDESTFTADEWYIKNWATIIETDYPEYLPEDAPLLILLGAGRIMDGIRAHLNMGTPENYTELRSVFFFEDGTYAIAEYENIKCICPVCGEIEYLEHPFYTQVHNVTDIHEEYAHKQETYWLFKLNDGRIMKASLIGDGYFTFVTEEDAAA